MVIFSTAEATSTLSRIALSSSNRRSAEELAMINFIVEAGDCATTPIRSVKARAFDFWVQEKKSVASWSDCVLLRSVFENISTQAKSASE